MSPTPKSKFLPVMRFVLSWLRTGGLAAAVMVGAMVSNANAEIVIQFDLSVVNQVTISATTGTSLATVSGSDGSGVYFEDFLGNREFVSGNATRISGDLVYFNSTSDNTPSLYRGNSGTDPGLNIYSMDNDSPDPASFTEGVQAFKGSATFGLTAAAYASFLQAPTIGDIYAFADDLSDLNGTPQIIGQYSVGGGPSSVPEPSSIAMLAVGALGVAYRRRRKKLMK